MASRLKDNLLLLFLFLLPWQTRYIWHQGQLNGGEWEYGTFSVFGTEILLWIILFLFLAEKFGSGEARQEFWARAKAGKRAAIFFVFFLVVLAASVFTSAGFNVSFNFVFHLLEAMALAVVLADAASVRFPTLKALWLGGVGQGILGLYQFCVQRVDALKWMGLAAQKGEQLGASVVEFADQRWLRAYGAFGSPNGLGIFLAVILIIGLIIYLNEKKPVIKILIAAGQMFVLTGLLVSFSRGAWLAALAGLGALLAILLLQKSKAGLVDFAKQAAAFVLLSAIIVFVFRPVFFARFDLSNRLERRSAVERTEQYDDALSTLTASNFLFGVGPGAYTLAAFQRQPNIPAWQYQPAHDIYLLILVEMGIVGLALFVFANGKMIENIARNNLIFLPAIISLLAAGLFDHFLWSLYGGLVFWWVVWGLAVARPPVRQTLDISLK